MRPTLREARLEIKTATLTVPGARKARVSAAAAASPTRRTATPAGKAESSRLGVWRSSSTNTPRSVARRISRPNAWRSRSRAIRSSKPLGSPPERCMRRSRCRMSGRGHGTRSNTTSRSARPGTSTPSRIASVPSRQLSSSVRKMSTRVALSIGSTCCASSGMPAASSAGAIRACTACSRRIAVNSPSAAAARGQEQRPVGGRQRGRCRPPRRPSRRRRGSAPRSRTGSATATRIAGEGRCGAPTRCSAAAQAHLGVRPRRCRATWPRSRAAPARAARA